jgi:tripartite-type tricarboxylate transporter receptor subunit TctC
VASKKVALEIFFVNQEMETAMKIHLNRRSMVGAALGAALSGLSMSARAQSGTFPSRPIKIIVPWAAGGGGDVLVRALAPSISQRLGQQVVVENRPGAIGTIGSLAVARSPADGYTLIYGAADSHSIAPHIMKTAPYDSKKDFTAVAPIGFTPLALIVSASHPAKNLTQFLQMAKEAKEPMTYGSWGQGSSGQITMEALQQVTKVNLLHVPYNSTAPLMQGQLSNQVVSSIIPVLVADPHVRAGTVRVLAITARARLSSLPDVPIMKEFGVPLEMGPWLGFLAPAGIPAEALQKLHAAIDASMAEPQIIETMKKMSIEVDRLSPSAYQQFYNSEFDRWGNYIRTAKISLE